MSGVSVRTLHFYDETGLLKPAYHGANGYRYYGEQQLLMLQQILFYRELGFELKQIRHILGKDDFERVAALESHREVLHARLSRTRTLTETIDKTIQHLKGTRKMTSEEMFAGFTVPAGGDRFEQPLQLGEDHAYCKLSAKDTSGAACIFEFTAGWPRHLHHDVDEWIYVVDGQVEVAVGDKRFVAGAGESVFIPREVKHGWAPSPGSSARVINVYQPAGRIEEFVQAVSNFKGAPTREEVINKTYDPERVEALCLLFKAYGMELFGPDD